jgi:hypothetical protein
MNIVTKITFFYVRVTQLLMFLCVFHKRWEDDSRPLRVLTGSIDKIIKWEKIIETSVVLFEVVGE